MNLRVDLMQVAATLTLSVCGNVQSITQDKIKVNPDGTVTVPDELKADDLLDFAVFQIMCNAVSGVYALPATDPNWKLPAEDGPGGGGGAGLAGLIGLLTKLTPGSQEAKTALPQLQAILAKLTAGQTPAAPIQAPGVTATT